MVFTRLLSGRAFFERECWGCTGLWRCRHDEHHQIIKRVGPSFPPLKAELKSGRSEGRSVRETRLVAAATVFNGGAQAARGPEGLSFGARKPNPRHAAGRNKGPRRPEALPARARILPIFRYPCRRPPTRVVMQIPQGVNPKKVRHADPATSEEVTG